MSNALPPTPGQLPLSDRWHIYDFPVLVAVAEQLDAGQRFDSQDVARATGIDADEVRRAVDALVDGRYLRRGDAADHAPRRQVEAWSRAPKYALIELAERGRRAVGLWPSEQSADKLVDLLRQAEDLTDDPEEKGRLRQATGALLGVSRDIVADVGAAWVRAQTGL